MNEKILRNYLEITTLKDFKEVKKPSENYSVKLAEPKDFQLNKFFYKNIGKKYHWIDRLVWSELDWTIYISNKKLFTYVLKDNNEFVGYFEMLFDEKVENSEIAYFGILEEYHEKKLGGYLLSEAIKVAFSQGAQRMWVHTCSKDHKNALKNYLARGMKVFKSETLII